MTLLVSIPISSSSSLHGVSSTRVTLVSLSIANFSSYSVSRKDGEMGKQGAGLASREPLFPDFEVIFLYFPNCGASLHLVAVRDKYIASCNSILCYS